MNIIEKPVDQLIPYENNPRLNDDAVPLVMESIKQFGFKVPIVIDRENVIVTGHTRLKAAKRLGMKAVPCIVADDLTPEQVKAFRLADNKVAEFAEWDFSALEEELDRLEIDMSAFGFEIDNAEADFFSRENRDGAQREEGNDEYNEFLEKFEAKKTTDDCYTPDNIYDAVADWVAKEYDLDKSRFVRPFYPGGDYKAEKYPKGSVVVDNPPFSILAEIVDFYAKAGVNFFLFAPTLTMFSSSSSSSSCSLCVGVTITYENGASVNTSFLTNLEEGLRLRSAPSLYNAVKEANDANLKELHRELPRYSFPDYVITSTRCGQFSRYGIDFRVPVSESVHVRALDAQKESGKGLFGSAYLLSERMKREKEKAEREKTELEKAEREKAERWELSEREMAIIRELGR